MINQLNDEKDAQAAQLERGLLSKFDSGCSLPLGVYSEVSGNYFRLKAILGIKDENSWTGLKSVDLKGHNIPDLVDLAFDKLQED